MPVPKSKTTILEKEIWVFAPLKGPDQYCAVIEGFGGFWLADTPMEAHRKANVWRHEQYNRVCAKEDRVPVPGQKSQAAA